MGKKYVAIALLSIAASLGAQENGWTSVPVPNSDFQLPGGSSRSVYVYAVDGWTRSRDSGLLGWGQGNFVAFAKGVENELTVVIDETARPGEYRLSVKTTSFSFGLRSRVEIGFMDGEIVTILAASEIVPAVWQRSRFTEEQWTVQRVVALVGEGSPMIGLPLHLRLTGSVDPIPDLSYTDQLNIWDDLELEWRPLP